MFRLLLAWGWLGAALVTVGCATGPPPKPTANKFYNNAAVRRCLHLDQRRQASEAQACWSELLGRLNSDPAFRKGSELSEADLAKIRRKVGQSADRSHDLRRQLEACYNLPSTQRDKRLACLQDYLARHRERLTVGERFEVETAIRNLEQARDRAAGKLENTVEHAARLLGAKLHLEDEGVRIDAIQAAPLAQAQLPEQGIIVALDGVPIGEFDQAERIARLEACQDRSIELLVRQGGAGQVAFSRVTCRCGPQAACQRLGQVRLPAELCTEAGSPELRLGLSWCYLPRDGILEVEQVCKGSPADAAGLQPGQQLVAINGRPILGLTVDQINALLQVQPAAPLRFGTRGSALQSPGPLSGPPLSPQKAAQFWQAVKRAADIEERTPRP